MDLEPAPTGDDLREQLAYLEEENAELRGIIEDLIEPRFMTDRLYRLVQHGLSQTIAAHGPVTRGYLPSATKRITQNIRQSLRELFKASWVSDGHHD